MIFPDAPLVNGMNVPRYPSQLIEALLEGLLLQLMLIAVRFSTKREGAVALTFMAGYAILRIVGEQFREPDADIGFWFGTVTQGQLLSGAHAADHRRSWPGASFSRDARPIRALGSRIPAKP